MVVRPGRANTCALPLVKADNSRITAGVVNFYLVAWNGVHAGKWWSAASGDWEATEQVAGVATHKARGHWFYTFPSAVWEADVEYYLYAEKDDASNVPVGAQVLCEEKFVQMTRNLRIEEHNLAVR